MTDDEIWERTKKTYAKGVNDKLNAMIKNANFSPNTEALVRKATRMMNGSADDKLKFVSSLTKPVKFTDRNGKSVKSGYAEFMIDSYKVQKDDSSRAVPTKNKWDRGFESFLRIADKHNEPLLSDSSSRGIGNTSDKPS